MNAPRITEHLSPDDEAQLRKVVADITTTFGHDYFTRISAAGEKASALWNALADGGFVGANIPEQFGGAGMGLAALSAVAEETAAAGCPLIMLIISPAIAGSVLAAHGDDEQKQRWLAPIGTGAGKVAFAITEPDAGSNTHRITTTARRDGDRWVLNGSKVYISGLDEAQALLVVARTGTNEATGRGELSLFVVDADAQGLTRQPIPMNLTMPDTQFAVFFDNVEVTPDRLIGGEGRGLRAVFSGLNPERVIIASISTGIGRYAMDKAVTYANQRSVWGSPIGAHQGIAHPLAEAQIHLEAARHMTQRAARLYDLGQDAGEASNMAKFLAAEAGIRCLDQAIEVHGGSGFAHDVGLADMLTLARLFKTVPITREMILNYVAEHSLGLPNRTDPQPPRGDDMASMVKRSQTSRAERRDRIRAKLLGAVEELLHDGESFVELPVERIASTAGVSRSTFYVYFADKGELLQGWLDDIFDEVAAAARYWYRLPAGATHTQVRDVLAEVLQAYRPHAGLMSAVSDASAYDPIIRTEVAAHMSRQIHGLTRYIRTGQTAGAIDPTLPAEETASWLVWMAERGLHQLMRNITDERAEALIDGFTAIVWNTLYRPTRTPT